MWLWPNVATVVSQTRNNQSSPGLKERPRMQKGTAILLLLTRLFEKEPYLHWLNMIVTF